jgi:hypothetical protein
VTGVAEWITAPVPSAGGRVDGRYRTHGLAGMKTLGFVVGFECRGSGT